MSLGEMQNLRSASSGWLVSVALLVGASTGCQESVSAPAARTPLGPLPSFSVRLKGVELVSDEPRPVQAWVSRSASGQFSAYLRAPGKTAKTTLQNVTSRRIAGGLTAAGEFLVLRWQYATDRCENSPKRPELVPWDECSGGGGPALSTHEALVRLERHGDGRLEITLHGNLSEAFLVTGVVEP